ncbi:Rad52/Rad22 family DNA repair protein [Neobacillus sp.]|uniref:Rad52/Rad22 family DNA repair protein n=1 Tax=Neobacillus sp. TaxID=2675273 RepID=UPI0035B548A6
MKNNCSMEEISKKLQAPFSSKDIEWRVNRCGVSNGKQWAMVLAYVTNRAIQNRLDEVFGPGGWKNEFHEFMQGVLCTISCNINGEWISKTDGAEQTQFESLKGGLSGAMKRAAVQWGIGRYLYNLEECFVEITPNKSDGAIYINDKKSNIKGYWVPPKLPDWALPQNEQSQQEVQKQPQPKQNPDRANIVKAIKEFIVKTGLAERKNLILPLFKRINPKVTSLNEVYENAPIEELKKYYLVLRPVNDLVNIVNYYKIKMEDALQYVQILCPETRIENLFSCFLHLDINKVKEVNEMIKEELRVGHLQRIA